MLARNLRHVTQRDQGAGALLRYRRYAGSEGGAEAVREVGVVDILYIAANCAAERIGLMSGHDDDRGCTRLACCIHGVPYHGFPIDLYQELIDLAHATGLSSG